MASYSFPINPATSNSVLIPAYRDLTGATVHVEVSAKSDFSEIWLITVGTSIVGEHVLASFDGPSSAALPGWHFRLRVDKDGESRWPTYGTIYATETIQTPATPGGGITESQVDAKIAAAVAAIPTGGGGGGGSLVTMTSKLSTSDYAPNGSWAAFGTPWGAIDANPDYAYDADWNGFTVTNAGKYLFILNAFFLGGNTPDLYSLGVEASTGERVRVYKDTNVSAVVSLPAGGRLTPCVTEGAGEFWTLGTATSFSLVKLS